MITGSCERERIDEVRPLALDQPSCGVAVTGLERAVAVALEVADDDLADDRLVVDDEDGGHARDCHPSPRRECCENLNSPPVRDP
jgi:hypothetical protein